jgi:hypothetical protein
VDLPLLFVKHFFMGRIRILDEDSRKLKNACGISRAGPQVIKKRMKGRDGPLGDPHFCILLFFVSCFKLAAPILTRPSNQLAKAVVSQV